jgi:CheY-like chemotaxis protein
MRVCQLVQPLATDRGIEVFEPEISDDLYITADMQRLKQVMINLLSNAIKYNREGRAVRVTAAPLGSERVRITVTDEGHGLTQAEIAKLFTPFERLGATNSDVEGTGLGLCLSRSLMTAMGGALHAESVLGEGSAFHMDFRLAQAPALTEPTGETSPESPLPTDRTYTVLCIEDNMSNLRLLEVLLSSRSDIKLITATDGRSGLSRAQEGIADVILLDLHLPELSGQQVLRELRGSPATESLPIVIVSADATPGQIEELMRDGASAYLTKPLDLKLFLATLDQVLEL